MIKKRGGRSEERLERSTQITPNTLAEHYTLHYIISAPPSPLIDPRLTLLP